MDVQETASQSEGCTKERRTTTHLDLSSKLDQFATRIVDIMRLKPGASVLALRKRGISVLDYGKGHVIECLSQTFKIEPQFVWLDKSATLGLVLRAVGSDGETSSDCVAQLILRSDGLALVRGIDHDFERSVVQDADIDETAAVFLSAVADASLASLTKVPF
jgi:hypothetical protein